MDGVAELFWVSPHNWEVVGSIPGQDTYLGVSSIPCLGTYGRQPTNASLALVFLSLLLSIEKQWKNVFG